MVNQLVVSGILFDLDGTLIDTIECIEIYWRKLCDEYSIDADELFSVCHGVQTIKLLERFFPKEIANQKTVEELEYKVMNDTTGVFVVEGARELLAKIPYTKWGIVTSGTHLMAVTRINQMKLTVPDCFFPSDKVSKSKPDPEGYIKGAQFLGLNPRDCVVFEDAIAGVKAGFSAGCTVIGILSSHTNEKQLIEAGATFCIRNYNDLEVKTENGKILISLIQK
ncbi:hypothetical protein BB561_002090 [Smittium simulii]|uniref:Uncharacterized protein n=1 Tax=Smittium simulii TaxID=133385 RepID=A0A2T9YRQ9_9FUNG|nr:hypothetical protein BB561_002090 [Smittium simulii]